MVIFSDGSWQLDSEFPNSDFTNGKAVYVVPDNSELAAKIQSMSLVVPITDSEGNLIDVEAISSDRTTEIKHELSQLDLATVRPLRAITAGTATDEDRERLAELEQQAATLRAELAGITKGG